MIAACETQDFVPFGKEYIHLHPGTFEIQVQRSHHADHGLPLLRSFRDISISEQSPKEQWTLHCRPTTDGHCGAVEEEELYVSGNTVIWSVGTRQEAKQVLKTFTVESPVIQAMCCTFLLSHSNSSEAPETTSLDLPGDLQEGICVLESTTASVFTNRGEEYSVALPFQVTKSWVIKNGLLFERSLSTSETLAPKSSRSAPNQTILFSMLHPLNDIAPVISRSSNCVTHNKISYFTDTSQHIVFSCINPSILLIYDNILGIHSVWNVRRVKVEESNSLFETWDMSSFYRPSTLC